MFFAAAVCPSCTGGGAAEPEPPPEDEVVFHGQVAPVLHARCSPCHHSGGSGPFSLVTYREASRRARQIAVVTADRFMPPWQPAATDTPLIGERRLSDEEISLFQRWYAGGTPAGDPAKGMPAPEYSDEWALGEPDLVIHLPDPYVLPAAGSDVIRNFVIPVPVDGPRYVRTLDLRPGNAAIVHHAIIKTDPTRASRQLDLRDDEPGFPGMEMGHAESPDGHLVVWAPGTRPYAGREDIAWRLEPGTDLVLQLHMVPSGKDERIQPSIAFYFARRPPTRQAVGLMLRSEELDIPAGDANYRVSDTLRLPAVVEVLGLFPHAHYLGKEMFVRALLPDGTSRTLLHIPDWDFNWQDMYRFAEPVVLPAGSTLEMDYRFDNSAENIRNPNYPPRRVVGGNRSEDEMATLGVQVVPRDPADLLLLQAAQFEKLVRDDPRNTVAHYNLGVVSARRGDLAAAEGHYRRALALDPGDAGTQFNLGGVLARLGKLAEAEAHYRSAIRLQPDDAQAHYFLGRVLGDQGRADEAANRYRDALQHDPDFARAHYRLGLGHLERGELSRAEEHLTRASRLAPDDADVARALDRLKRIRRP